MFDELVKRLRECPAEQNGEKTLWHQAADAIEELQAQLIYSNDAAKDIAEKVPKWIPVAERLPSWGEDVLISISRFCNVGHLVQTNDEKQYNWYYSGWYHDPMEVTHWMPLPQTPKDGE